LVLLHTNARPVGIAKAYFKVMSSVVETFKQTESVVNGEAALVAGENHSSTPAVKVWLVDDNDELRTLIAEVLGHHGGIDCVRHFSSPDALLSALASKPGPDVILLDVQMGDRNGLDAVRPIKSLTRATRVLMFTTCYNHEWRERALDEGASDYLLKSDRMEKVVARIRTAVQDPAANNYSRRRSNHPVRKAVVSHPDRVDKSPRILKRTLGALRGWWN